MPFGRRAYEAMASRGPVCVGIDPHAGLLADWGLTDDASGLETFAMTVVEALAGEVAFLKPQSAFFERHGSQGVAVLEKVLAAIGDAEALSILDVKRGDIGSTAAAYADAYLDPSSPLAADAITVSPFLGFGSLDPFFEAATAFGGGVFVLALTSNPEGREVQHASGGYRTVAGTILDRLAALNSGAEPLGSFGAVVGATVGEISEDVAINGPILVPGFGAQGGTADDLTRLFGHVMGAVIPTTSRGVLGAGPSPTGLLDAARRTNDILRPSR